MVEGAVALAPSNQHKLARTLVARRNLVSRITTRAREVRDQTRPLVWFHAPSVGEGLQARPVIDALRAAHPQIQVAYTFFSPSAESFARSINAEFRDYLPFDTASNARAMVDALRPTAIVFAKLDVWPMLVEVATQRGIPCLLMSATVAPRSGRLGFVSRMFLNDAYASLTAVGAIDADNAARLERLGVPRERIRVTGDTRFDQVAARAREVDRQQPPLAALASTRPTVVAGSTWPADESVLLPAWTDVIRSAAIVRPRLIIAPHEPTAPHLKPIEEWAATSGLQLARLDQASSDTDVVLVDRIGVLGQLYALADVAFVGGGFHSAGLHSVIEPAAFGAPVLFGPRHDTSREAGLLLGAGGARVVSDRASLVSALTHWLSDEPDRRSDGAAALNVVRSGEGAVERTVEVIETTLERHP